MYIHRKRQAAWSALLAPVVALAACRSPVQVADLAAGAWEPPRRLTAAAGESRLSFNFARAIAAESSGRVHVAWYDTRDGRPQVYHTRSIDGGRTWEAGSRPSPWPAAQENPAIALAGDTVFIVWHEVRSGGLNVVLARSFDAGRTWAVPVVIGGSGSAAHASVVAEGGALFVTWGDTRTGHAEVHFRRSLDGGTTWDPDQRISMTPYASWVPAVAASGPVVIVAWVDYADANEEEYVRVSTDRGASWGPLTRLTHDPADSWAPSLLVTGDTVHLAWFDRRDAAVQDAAVEATLDSAAVLVGLAVDPPPPRDPAVYYLDPLLARIRAKQEAIRNAAPAWVARGNDPARLDSLMRRFEDRMREWSTGWEIYYKRSTDRGRVWGPDQRLTFAAGASARPSLAAEGDVVRIVWFDERDGNMEIYSKASTDGGTRWGPDERITTDAGASMHPMIALAGGLAHVVWFDDRGGASDLYYSRRRIR